MEFKSILIKDTTVEERKQIVKESLGNISASCDGCMARLSEMYEEYIEGKKEIRDINMEFNGMGQSVNTNFQAINLLKYESSVEISIFYTWISSKDSYFSFLFL